MTKLLITFCKCLKNMPKNIGGLGLVIVGDCEKCISLDSLGAFLCGPACTSESLRSGTVYNVTRKLIQRTSFVARIPFADYNCLCPQQPKCATKRRD